MIEVITQDSDGERVKCVFDTNAVEVIHGALIVYTRNAKSILAGFAPSQWLTFQFIQE